MSDIKLEKSDGIQTVSMNFFLGLLVQADINTRVSKEINILYFDAFISMIFQWQKKFYKRRISSKSTTSS
jgi:hypothetical protein